MAIARLISRPNARRMVLPAAALAVGLMLVSGCSAPARLDAVPRELSTAATIPGMANVRYYIDVKPEEMVEAGYQAVLREQQHLAGTGHQGSLPPAIFLAISGGGDNGAFGAGLLVGWSAAGTRPEFKVVTGISTGALIAPFAFLGPDYDPALRQVYTTMTADDIFVERNLLQAIFGDAMTDNAPLFQLVKRFANQEMLDAIAREHAKGRLLLVATTDLDARQSVVWDIGAIASSGDPGALELFHKILVASAAIPGAFPPMMIDVEANGQHYQEMHVDGGTMAQTFIYPPSVNLHQLSVERGLQRERKLYIIRNARLDPDWASVDRQILSIAGRAIASLIQTQGIGDLFKIYVDAERDQVDYNLAFVGADFTVEHKTEFDPTYMGALFEYAFAQSSQGYPWKKYPPGFTPNE